MIFLVGSFILSAYEICHPTSLCPVRFLLINLLIVSQEFLVPRESLFSWHFQGFFFFLLFDNFIIIYLIVDSFEYIFLGSIGLLESEVHQFSSVAQSCPTLCDPMNCSMPGLPIHHQFLEFTQTHVHWVGYAIQPSHPLLSPSPVPNPSQHQGVFQWVNSLHEVAKVLEFQL